jgi:uncharacterized protein (TIGR02145 family)
MAIQVSSINFSGQTANVSIYAATGTTIPFSAATTINVGTQTMPFTYSSATISNEYGTFSCQFPGLSNKICTASQLTPPDGDGNRYRTIKIGNQVWMSESLRTTKFQDETTLLDNLNNDPVDNFTWGDASIASSKYWAYVHDDPNSKAIEGLLYNQYAVTGSTQGAPASSSLCPAGWHVPTLSEANTFVANIGTNAGARYPGIVYWVTLPLQFQGTNISGFNSLGSDSRFTDGSYSPNTGYGNVIWTTSPRNTIDIGITPGTSPIVATYTEPFDERFGFSVRCIKD